MKPRLDKSAIKLQYHICYQDSCFLEIFQQHMLYD